MKVVCSRRQRVHTMEEPHAERPGTHKPSLVGCTVGLAIPKGQVSLASVSDCGRILMSFDLAESSNIALPKTMLKLI